MSITKFRVSAPSRLHFGLFSVGDLVSFKFGGIGLMISAPRTEATFCSAPVFSANGLNEKQTSLIRKFAQRWFEAYSNETGVTSVSELPVAVEVTQSPPPHAGLGSGTQLAATLGAGLSRMFHGSQLSPEELAHTMKRGKRSAIGSYGFSGGGFMIDRGKSDDSILSPLDFHVDFPKWPIVLIQFRELVGLFGRGELDAFAEIPPTSESDRQLMLAMARDRIAPSLLTENFEEFSAALYEYGRQSGMLFESVQGGPYNGSDIQQLIDSIRGLGFAGTGQSSWGPTVFAMTRDLNSANGLIESLDKIYGPKIQTQITTADNRGVIFENLESN